MSEPWRAACERALGARVSRLDLLGGGDFARAFRATLDDGDTVFVKTHDDPPPGFFTTEAAGLIWLGEAGAANVPTVRFASDTPPCLVLSWVEPGPVSGQPDGGEAIFGRALADLHRAGAAAYGRDDGRTTGSLALPNDPLRDWADFQAERRLLPLARIATDRRALPTRDLARLERVAARLHEVGGADEPPARLHGDLWAGNRLVDREGASWLIDPAAHGGHREFDLAMMRLFGGFGEACHAAYREHAPLTPGWESRVPLHQLAPLVVHAIKFGGGYVAAVATALDACERL